MKNLKLILLTLLIFVSGLQAQNRKAMFFKNIGGDLPSIVLTTTSTSTTWSPNTIINTGDILHWEVTGAVTTNADANDPTFNFSPAGTKTVTITSTDNLDGLTQFVFLTASYDLATVTLLNVENLTTLRLQNQANMTTVSVTNCPSITHFAPRGAPNVSFDLNDFPALTFLNAFSCGLTTLDLSPVGSTLERADIWSNGMTSLTLTGCSALLSLACYSNSLTSLNTEDCTSITDLQAHNNNITSFDFTNNTSLGILFLQNNNNTTLDITALTSLINVNVQNIPITALDSSNNTLLKTFTILGCSLTVFEVNQLILDSNMDGLTGTRTLNYSAQNPTANPTNTGGELTKYNALVSSGVTVIGVTPQ